MTIKEKLTTIKDKNISILCETRKEAFELVTYLNEITNYTYNPYSPDIYEQTCFNLESIDAYGIRTEWNHFDAEYCEDEEIEVVPYKEFVDNCDVICNKNSKTVITSTDIEDILNTKYGKDNWTIQYTNI